MYKRQGKPQTRGRERDNVPPRHDFVGELKDLIAIPNVAERLKVPPPPKIDKRIGPNKNSRCEFHQAFDHNIRNCLALGHQLDELVKNGLLWDYLQEKQGIEDVAVSGVARGTKSPCMVRFTPSREVSREEVVLFLSGGDTHGR